MKKQDIILTAAFKKAQNVFLGKMGACEVYQVADPWVYDELVQNHTMHEIENVTDFEKALQSEDPKDLIVSAYLINRPALEKILMRSPYGHRIFYISVKESK